MIRKTGNAFLASSSQMAIPGCYESERAAKYAFRFPNEVLQSLQNEINEKEPDYEKRVISFEMLQNVARRRK